MQSVGARVAAAIISRRGIFKRVAIMFTTILKHGALALTILPTLGSANDNEQVMLANCIANNNPNQKSSYVAYYANTGDPSPSATTKVSTPAGQTVWWEGAPVSALFSDSNVFSVSIPERITTENAYVGTGKNNFGLFSCWRQTHTNAFTVADGSICSGIYICNHHQAPSSGIKVQTTIGNEAVVFDGDINIWDIFHTVWDNRLATSCTNKPVTISGASISDGGCTITYDCYGATDWIVTNGMASTLVSFVSPAVKTLSTYTTRECTDTSDITRKCIAWENVKHTQSHIMDYGRLDVTNEEPVGSNVPNSYAGWMTYKIQCPSSNRNCAGCKIAENVLSGGAVAGTATGNPEVAAFFGGVDLLTTVFCELSGC